MRTTRLALKLMEETGPKYVLCDYLGIKNTRLSEYMHGKKEIPHHHLMKLIEYFGCNPAELIGWADDTELRVPA